MLLMRVEHHVDMSPPRKRAHGLSTPVAVHRVSIDTSAPLRVSTAISPARPHQVGPRVSVGTGKLNLQLKAAQIQRSYEARSASSASSAASLCAPAYMSSALSSIYIVVLNARCPTKLEGGWYTHLLVPPEVVVLLLFVCGIRDRVRHRDELVSIVTRDCAARPPLSVTT